MMPNYKSQKQAYNAFYYFIHGVKKRYWQKFLINNDEIQKENISKT